LRTTSFATPKSTNIEWDYGITDGAHNFAIVDGTPFPAQCFLTKSAGNLSSDATAGGNTNNSGSPPTNPYTSAQLAVAVGTAIGQSFTNVADLMAYAVAHPEAFLARQALTTAATGYDLSLSGYTP
jgi:hypothetical protein